MNIGKFELKATSKAYCDLKQKIGAPNLKVRFLTAYEQMDLDFFADVILAFADPRPKNKDEVFTEFDRLMGEGFLMDDIYSELVSFAYGMGFFGRIDLPKDKEGVAQSIQDYMREPLNKMDFSGAMFEAMSQAAADIATAYVR